MNTLIKIIFFVFLFIYSCTNNKINYEKLNGLNYYNEQEDSITLKLINMGYACGECITLYRIDSILYSENNEYKYYINKEITIDIKNKQLKNQILELDCEHRCIEYILTGYFRRNNLGMGKLEVVNGEIIMKDNCCN